MNLRFGVGALLMALFCGSEAQAATFCVTSGNQLNIALRDSSLNGLDDEIRVAVGVHVTDYHAPEDYQWSHRIANPDELDKDITISGGWSAGSNCAVQVSQNPSDTVLDAKTWGPVYYADPTNSIPGWAYVGTYTLRNLTFSKGKSFFQYQPTGILINAVLAAPGSLVIDNVHVRYGQSSLNETRAVSLHVSGSGSVRLRNSIVSDNVFTGTNSFPVGVFPYNSVIGYVTNNSVYGNSVTSHVAGMIVINTATITNNAVADNVSTAVSSYQFWTDQPTSLTLEKNHFANEEIVNGPPFSEIGTTTGDAKWTLNGVRRVPNADSPLRDSGDNTPTGQVPNIDFSGQPRIVNVTIDRGAVESDAPPAAVVGPLVTAASPANGSTTVLQGPIAPGVFAGTQLTFDVSGGVAPAVTKLECSIDPGSSVLFGLGSPGETVAVGGSVIPIDVGFDEITSELQYGSVTCVVTRDLAGTSYLTYNFVAAPPGGPAVFDSDPKAYPDPAYLIKLTPGLPAIVGTDVLPKSVKLYNIADFGDSDLRVFLGASGGSDPQVTINPQYVNGGLIPPQGVLEVEFDCDTSTPGSYFANWGGPYDLDQEEDETGDDGSTFFRVECEVRPPPETHVETTPPSGTTTTQLIEPNASANFDFSFAEVSPDPDPPADANLLNCTIVNDTYGAFSIQSPSFPGGPYPIVNGSPVAVQVLGTDNSGQQLYTATLHCEYTDTDHLCPIAEGTIDVGHGPGAPACGTADFPLELRVRDNALFHVTKEFTDDENGPPNPTEVDVTISCFTGLPLTQTQAISQTRDVVFVVESFDRGELDCEITEDTGAPALAGYTPAYTPGGPDGTQMDDNGGCNFHALEGGTQFSCAIVNEADPVPVVIEKDWIIEGSGGDQVNQNFELTLYCDAEIVGGEDGGDTPGKSGFKGCGNFPALAAGNPGRPPNPSNWCLELEGNGDTTFTPEVIPEWPSSHCWVDEEVYDDSVEVDNDCGDINVSHGEGDSCLITNTVFFEGIPTLSRYGMAIMALLMMGVGLVGFRRLV